MEEMKKKHEVYPQSVLSLLLFHNARLQEKNQLLCLYL